MAKRYRRYSTRSKGNGGNPLALLALLVFFLFLKYWKIALLVIAAAAVAILLVRYLKRRNPNELPEPAEQTALNNGASPLLSKGEKPTYTSKASLMTKCERSFFEATKKIVEPEYIVQPQINLASIIDKESHNRYRNELFRNIDFGVLDRNYKLQVLIEINDKTHTERSRRERDQKVQAICAEAGIPLITLWTRYGVNEKYIAERLAKHLALPQNTVNEPAPVDEAPFMPN